MKRSAPEVHGLSRCDSLDTERDEDSDWQRVGTGMMMFDRILGRARLQPCHQGQIKRLGLLPLRSFFWQQLKKPLSCSHIAARDSRHASALPARAPPFRGRVPCG